MTRRTTRATPEGEIDFSASRSFVASRLTRHASRVFRTPWGWVGLSASPRGVRTIILPKASRREVERALAGRRRSTFDVRSSQSDARVRTNLEPRTLNCGPILRAAQSQIMAFLAGQRRDIAVPVDLSGRSAFQRRVWRAIRRIPYGRARSYKWVASRVGGARYARAVGLALGANPVPLVIPCHRVVTSGGSLGGFTGGRRLKRRLLALEGTLALLAPAGKRREARGKRMGMFPAPVS